MKSVLYNLAIIALGGAIGAVLRYGTSGFAYRTFGATFPWGTLTVNALGSFAIGLLWGLADLSALSPEWKTFLFIGILGSFTTFSTFSLETVAMMQDREVLQAGINVTLSVFLGLFLAWLGFALGEYLGMFAGGR